MWSLPNIKKMNEEAAGNSSRLERMGQTEMTKQMLDHCMDEEEQCE